MPLSRCARLALPFVLAGTLAASAQTTFLRAPQGTTHGFLSLHNSAGDVIGYGDVLQTLRGPRVTSRLSLHFNDGSLDDEITVFTQDRAIRFVSDHHIQHGPLFPKSLDLTIKANGDLLLRTRDNKDAPEVAEKLETSHLALPSNLANGLLPVLLLNTPPNTPETLLSVVVPYSKGRLVQLRIIPDGTQPFAAGGVRRTADILLVHPQLGGVAGLVAPLIGKQPADARLWLEPGDAPQLLRMDAQLAEGGPIISIRLAGLSFPPAAPAFAAASPPTSIHSHSGDAGASATAVHLASKSDRR